MLMLPRAWFVYVCLATKRPRTSHATEAAAAAAAEAAMSLDAEIGSIIRVYFCYVLPVYVCMPLLYYQAAEPLTLYVYEVQRTTASSWLPPAPVDS